MIEAPYQLSLLDQAFELSRPVSMHNILRRSFDSVSQLMQSFSMRYPDISAFVWRLGIEWSYGEPQHIGILRMSGFSAMQRAPGVRLTMWDHLPERKYFQSNLVRGDDGFASIGLIRGRICDNYDDGMSEYLRRMVSLYPC